MASTKEPGQKAIAGSGDFTTKPESWPSLPLEAWQDTYHTLHMWTQIVGKVRLALSPLTQSLGGGSALHQRPRA